MEARLIKIGLVIGALCSLGATKTTPNFVIHAPTDEIASQIAEAAEVYREEIAIEWIGNKLPRWSARCPIHVKVGDMGAGGATTFSFDQGEVFGWHMTIQGSLERILDSVLPHEISHTIFACHFRRPLPRWADEGAASLIEHDSERYRLRRLAEQVLGTQRKIPLRRLLAMKEYPTDMQQVLTLYAEGYSLADYLVQHGGKQQYLTLLDRAEKSGWDTAIRVSYGYRNVEELESKWDQWVIAGSPQISLPDGQQLVDRGQPAQNLTVRGQSPETPQQVAVAVSERPVVPSTERFELPLRNKSLAASGSSRREAPGSKLLGQREAFSDGWVPVSQDRRPLPPVALDRPRPQELTEVFLPSTSSN